jgi:phage shock protein PspC (stress-responsive transcriptional regulator)
MTTTPPEAEDRQGPEGPRATREELKDLGRIRRTVGQERKIAGVAGGLARHLDIDPVILRVAFVVLVFFGGSGLLLYGACWLLLPEDGAPRAALGLDDRSRSVALVVVGAISALLLLGDSIGQFDFPWPLVLIALVALVVLVFLDKDRNPRPTAPPVPHRQDSASGQFVPAAPGTLVAPPPAPAYRPPPRNPRKRGPILFWFTMALAALGVGVLGILDLAGAPVADPAYPAVVVGTCGVMLVVGAFYGRAGGLILVGLVASVALALASITTNWDGSDIYRTPARAADVDSHLSTGAGEIVLDLTDVQDPAALDGRVLSLRVRTGRIEVILPPGVSAHAEAAVTGAGHIEMFGDERGGFDINDTGNVYGGPDSPAITIDARLFAGEIQIHTQEQS